MSTNPILASLVGHLTLVDEEPLPFGVEYRVDSRLEHAVFDLPVLTSGYTWSGVPLGCIGRHGHRGDSKRDRGRGNNGEEPVHEMPFGSEAARPYGWAAPWLNSTATVTVVEVDR